VISVSVERLHAAYTDRSVVSEGAAMFKCFKNINRVMKSRTMRWEGYVA
jgi:hypothetical protein